MSHSLSTVLLVEDDVDYAESVMSVLEVLGYRADHAISSQEAVEFLAAATYDAVITDVNLGASSGIDLLQHIRREDPLLPVIVATGSATTEVAIEAMMHGAFDYLRKPIDRIQLTELLEKACETRRMSRLQVRLPEATLPAGERRLIGNSPAMVALFKEIGRIARQPVPVLLLGETGTGKEIVARAIYHFGGWEKKPFVAINCAAIPENLIESELFGHERGAFTGATMRRVGRFEQAHEGIIFLDEIGELPLAMQAKLLRVLQEKEVQPIGSSQTKRVNVRILAATHRNLQEEIAAGRFREDLFFRLSLTTITLPPLRERVEDIPELVQHFTELHGQELGHSHQVKVLPEAMQWFVSQPWHGNIRELENAVRRALLLTAHGIITLSHAKAATAKSSHESVAFASPSPASGLDGIVARHLRPGEAPAPALPLLAELECETIRTVLAHTRWNKSRASEILGINRKTLREKMQAYGIDEPVV